MLVWGSIIVGVIVLLLCTAAYGRHVRRRQARARGRPAFEAPLRDRLFVESADAVEITLANGKSIRVKPLNVRWGTYFWRLFGAAAQVEDPARAAQAQELILDEFPQAVGAVEAIEDLTIAEFWELFRRFLSLRRTPDGAKTEDNPAAILAATTGGSRT